MAGAADADHPLEYHVWLLRADCAGSCAARASARETWRAPGPRQLWGRGRESKAGARVWPRVLDLAPARRQPLAAFRQLGTPVAYELDEAGCVAEPLASGA